MVSALMTAKKAKEVYNFPSMKVHGNSVELRNTNGIPVVVASSQLVYMRGKGNFGIYGDMRDAHRKSSGYDGSSHVGKVGTGDHRHEEDRHKKSSQGKPKSKSTYRKMFGGQDRSIYE